MAINPELITTIRVDQLPDETLSLTNLFPHTVGTDLKSATIQELVDLVATAIGVSGGVGYVAISVTDGQQLPDVPELPSFFLCGAGTFLNINGYPNIICTENLNAIMSLTDHWELAVEIPINPLSGTVQSVTGSAVDNTDPLNPVINEIIYGVQNIVAGTNITVDNTDPANPIVSATGGGVTPTLQEVLVEGNETNGEDIFINDGDSILFENGSLLKEGTYDFGGDGGISRICGVGFEDMWQAGIRHVFDSNGFIRHSTNCFEIIPDNTFDNTLRFKVDSFWTLDDGKTYKCTDASTGAAVWELWSIGSIPTLQNILDNNHDLVDGNNFQGSAAGDGNTGIFVNALGQDAANSNTGTQVNALGTEAANQNEGGNVNAFGNVAAGFNTGSDVNALGDNAGYENTFNNVNLLGNAATADEDGQTVLSKDGTIMARISTTDLTATRKYNLPDSSGTIALTSDIPSSSGIPHATASGTDTYTATITGVAAYTDADAYLIRFTNGNTTGATLNINSLGAKTLYRNNDGALIGGDIINGGEMLCIYNTSLNGFQVIGTAPNSLFAYVTNDDSVTLTKGMPVYAFSGTGDRITVKRAFNTSDATSAQTVGLVLSTSIAANQKGLIMMQGLLDGLSILPTASFADGDPVYLGATAGTITNVKPYAPNHLVYLGVVTTASNGSAGRMYVRIQNGFELSEIHDIDLISNSPTNNQVLTYESSTDLWKNKSIGTILGYTPYKFIQTSQTAHTGTVAETIIGTATINGATFNSSDVMKVLFKTTKPVSASSCNMRIRINTTNTLTGATQIAFLTIVGSIGYALMTRTFDLQNGNLYGYNFASTLASDIVATNTVGNTTAYNTANTLYLFFTIQLGNIADSATPNLCNITN
jgi:hypothetical protein